MPPVGLFCLAIGISPLDIVFKISAAAWAHHAERQDGRLLSFEGSGRDATNGSPALAGTLPFFNSAYALYRAAKLFDIRTKVRLSSIIGKRLQSVNGATAARLRKDRDRKAQTIAGPRRPTRRAPHRPR